MKSSDSSAESSAELSADSSTDLSAELAELSAELSADSSADSSADLSADSTSKDHVDPIQRKIIGSNDIFEATAKNELDDVIYFVEKKNIPVRAMNEDEQTAAHIAARNRNMTILRYLVSKDRRVVYVQDKWDQSVLHQATKAGSTEIVKFLVNECRSDPLIPKGRVFGDTCVHIAAQEGHLELLKFFLGELKINSNIRNTLGEPPLFLAADKQHLDAVQYLIESQRADPTQVDNNQRNILFTCATKGEVNIPKYLYEEKRVPININWQDVFGQTVLHLAAKFNKLKFIKHVVEERKADVNISSKNGVTPIQDAASEGYVDIVKYLYNHGADVNCKDREGNTLKKVAKRKEVKEFLDSLDAPQNSTRRRRSVNFIELEKPLSPGGNWLRNMINSNSLARTSIGLENSSPKYSTNQTQNWLAFVNIFIRHVGHNHNKL